MLNTGLRVEIPSKLRETADPTLIARYSKKIYPKKNRKMDTQYSTRNPNPVKTERDSRSYTTFRIIYSCVQQHSSTVTACVHTCICGIKPGTTEGEDVTCEMPSLWGGTHVWDDADQSTTTQSSASKPRKKASRPGTHAPEGEEVKCEMSALQENA